jgi:hypothetical protein
MKPTLRTAGMLAAIILLLAPDISFEPSPWVPWVPLQVTRATAEAQAGGRRRRTRRRTAVVVGTSVHAADQQADAQQQAAADQQVAAAQQEAADAEQRADAAEQEAAAAQQQAAAAQQQPAAPPATPADAGEPLPVGTVVQKLPDGCTSQASGGVEYHNCGGNYYRTAFQGNNLVYVTTAPP